MRFFPDEIVVAVALDIELLPINRPRCPIIVTGMGKLAASTTLVDYILRSPKEVELVVNLGSVGSRANARSTVLVDHFSCWDSDFPEVQGKGKVGDHLYSTDVRIDALELPWKKVHCATGDSFVSTQNVYADCFDMEAYALAYVCNLYQIPFLCVKYISDAGSVGDWVRALPQTQNALARAHDIIMNRVLERPVLLDRNLHRRLYMQDRALRDRMPKRLGPIVHG